MKSLRDSISKTSPWWIILLRIPFISLEISHCERFPFYLLSCRTGESLTYEWWTCLSIVWLTDWLFCGIFWLVRLYRTDWETARPSSVLLLTLRKGRFQHMKLHATINKKQITTMLLCDSCDLVPILSLCPIVGLLVIRETSASYRQTRWLTDTRGC